MEPDDFSVSPEEVSSQSEGFGGYNQPYRPPTTSRSGDFYNPFESMTGVFSGAKSGGGGFAGMQQAARPYSLYENDASFYANDLGDVGAAATLLQSKNSKSVFRMFEARSFDMGYEESKDSNGNVSKSKVGSLNYRIVPHGTYDYNDPQTGKTVKIPAWQLAQRRGVTSVPFKGGDEAANKFRDSMDNVSVALDTLSRIEEKYQAHGWLANWMPTEDAATTKALETMFTMQFTKAMFDLKAGGAQTTEGELELIKSIVPQRASTSFGRWGGNEMRIAQQAREMLLKKMHTVANDNGVALIPINAGVQKKRVASSQEANSKSML